MVVGKGEADRWLGAVLEQRKKLVDDMVICCNRTDRKTEKVIKKFGFWFYKDHREWGLYQPKIKQDLLEKISKLNPDWILPSDADEIYDKYFTREEAEKLARTNEIGFNFAVINLWNDEKHYRHDLSFWNVRFWNYKKAKDISLKFSNKRLHCGLAPAIVYKYAADAPFILKHYGLMKKEDREKKVERYNKYDPRAIFKSKIYYNSLRDEKMVRPFDEDKMHQRIVKDVQQHGTKIRSIQKNR